jgi:hypothetical protein
MFDGYNEDALRVLFFARSALSEYGGSAVAPEHLVIGALDACPRTVLRFASSAEALQQIRERMVAGVSHAAQICEDVEVPFSSEARSVLQQAGIEADELQSRHSAGASDRGDSGQDGRSSGHGPDGCGHRVVGDPRRVVIVVASIAVIIDPADAANESANRA